MNRKFKEFALKANLEYDVFLPDAWTGENKDLEKFDELIVKECVKVCEDGVNCAEDWDSSVWDQACINRGLAIKSHFGV